MATLDRQHQIAHGRDVGGHHVHVDAEALAEHAARLADAGDGVERGADRQRMQYGAAPAARTGGMSPAATAPPESSISATKRSLPRRPPESETTTDSSCTLALLSAISMAWRTIASTSTRSTTPPTFMPLAAV